ncbi:LOW QUALITY PROTEIN: elongation factor Ts, mitochondrial [Opisthocomus hoazin]|uniref:LOW QUALITY PROTEIN: elongation factor Ts, mitochondrial n=1 Tax=Opisthocomus hoazin TaxID=30419 RepID=UPI003F52E303
MTRTTGVRDTRDRDIGDTTAKATTASDTTTRDTGDRDTTAKATMTRAAGVRDIGDTMAKATMTSGTRGRATTASDTGPGTLGPPHPVTPRSPLQSPVEEQRRAHAPLLRSAPFPSRRDVIAARRGRAADGMQRVAAARALGGAARVRPPPLPPPEPPPGPPGRPFGASSPGPATAALRELRRRTGLPLGCAGTRCCAAGGELRQAEAWLEEQAQRQGWSRAVAGGGAAPRQGLLGLLQEGPAAAMVEVNCETDFVARTPEFQRVVELAALGALGHCRAAALPPTACAQHLLREEELAQLRAGEGLLSDCIASAMGKLGERVTLRRAGWLRVPAGDGHIGAYAHGWLPPGPPVAMGTYGALVALGVGAARPSPAQLAEVGRKVAQHVVGLAPPPWGPPQDLPQGEGEGRLLAQSFLLEPGVTVGQFLGGQGGLAVRGFLRFRCGGEGVAVGEGLPHGGGGAGSAP